MRFKFKKIPLYIFIAINLTMIVAMNFCAYTTYLHPATYPNWSYFGLAFPIFLVANIAFVLFWLIFKYRMIWLPLAGMLLCAGSVRTYCPINFPSEAPEGSIKLLSYNVMGFGANPRPEWCDNEIVRYIMDSEADIVCIQEAMRGDVNEAFDIFSEIYPYMDKQFLEDKNYLGCLSKYPILSTTKIDYESETNCSFAYEILVGKDTLTIVNNHFESYKLKNEDKEDYKSLIRHPKEDDAEEKYIGLTGKLACANAIRSAEVDSVAKYVEAREGKSVIVCGDFNDSSISYTHRRLTESLNDAYTRSGNGPGISYNRSGMYFRIDNILCSPNIEAYGAKVDNSIKVSDHYPIYCYLKLGEK